MDALAFFLVDRLLRPGGWIIFDDLDWTYAISPALKDTELVRNMPVDERTAPQVRKIYELLVKPHRSYHNFRVQDGWAYAQKRDDAATARAGQREIVTEQIIREKEPHWGVRRFLGKVSTKLVGK